MILPEKTERRAPRTLLSLPIYIERQEADNKIWREVILLKTVSKIGASFYLKRELFVGQLLLLTMPLPAELRFYDQTAEQYAVWGVVRHCTPISINNSPTYHIGIAFIGKFPPKSYRENPLQLYDIIGVREDGFWQVSELSESSIKRRHPRYPIPVNVYITIVDEQGNVLAHEKTVTENISLGGVTVFSSLDVCIGDKVKIIKQDGNFSAMAIIRNRRIGEDNLPRLHLELLNAQFPLEEK